MVDNCKYTCEIGCTIQDEPNINGFDLSEQSGGSGGSGSSSGSGSGSSSSSGGAIAGGVVAGVVLVVVIAAVVVSRQQRQRQSPVVQSHVSSGQLEPLNVPAVVIDGPPTRSLSEIGRSKSYENALFTATVDADDDNEFVEQGASLRLVSVRRTNPAYVASVVEPIAAEDIGTAGVDQEMSA